MTTRLYVDQIVIEFRWWRRMSQYSDSRKTPLYPEAVVPDDPLICAQQHRQGLLKSFVGEPGTLADNLRIAVQDPTQYIGASFPSAGEIPEGYPYDSPV